MKYTEQKAKIHSNEFTIWTNIPNIKTFNAAVTSWYFRTQDYSAESLVAYINSKTHMSGHKAFLNNPNK